MLGYYKDEYSNRVSFDREWFKTGDYGRLDKKGGLCLAGRKKNLIILDNGKNVHPEEIESVLIAQLSYIKDVVVHEAASISRGRSQRSIAAALSVDPASEMGLCSEEVRYARIAEDIRRVNRYFPPYKRICLIKVSMEEFEKTTTRKTVRHSAITKGKYATL